MDSRTVTRAIRREVRPLLESVGFERFTGRTSWRHTESRIDLLSFQSFNSYLAEGIGSTTYSFGVRVATFVPEVQYDFVPPIHKERDGRICPEEWDCQLRTELSRGFAQPELERRDVWFIDPEGRYLDQAMRDVLEQISTHALPWWERMGSDEYLLDLVIAEQPVPDIMGWNGPLTLASARVATQLARRLGRDDVAAQMQAAGDELLAQQPPMKRR